MKEGGQAQDSRAGGTLEYPEPVCTVYERPFERVLFDPVRDANPFFHLMEALWMLAGRRDVAWRRASIGAWRHIRTMASFNNAAYGYRWRRQFRPQNREWRKVPGPA